MINNKIFRDLKKEEILLIKNNLKRELKKFNIVSKEFKIDFVIKKKTWKKKVRIMLIMLLFIHRLKKLRKLVQYYGISNIKINPNFRDANKIKEELKIKKNSIIIKKNSLLKFKRKTYLFYPNTIFIFIWSLINLIFIFYFITFLPFFIVSFLEIKFFLNLEKIINIFFIIDIFLNFNTTYELENKTYEKSRKKITIKYLKTYFFIDLFTSIPFEFILYKSSPYNKIFRILKLPKFLTILKSTKVFKLKHILELLKLEKSWKFKIKVKANFFKTLYLILQTFFIVHISACIFVYIGRLDYLYPFTWINKQELSHKSSLEIYLMSVYYCFVVLTTVGFGDIVSVNNLERVFTLVWMMFGIAFYSFTIGFITEYFTNKASPKSLLEKKIKKIEKFIREKKLDKKILVDITESLTYSAKKISYRWLDSNMDFFKDMNQSNKYEFVKQMHKELFKSPFFNTKDKNFCTRIISLLTPVKIKKNQYVWKKEDNSNYICFITKGKLFLMIDNLYYENSQEREQEIKLRKNKKLKRSLLNFLKKSKITPRAKTKKLPYAKNIKELLTFKHFAIKYYGVGAYLGEEEIIFKTKRKFYLKAATNVELMLLSREDFDSIITKEYPHIYKKIYKTCEERKLNISFAKKKLNRKLGILARSQNIGLVQKTNKELLNSTFKLLSKRKKKNPNTILELFKEKEENNPILYNFQNINIPEYKNNEEEEIYSEGINSPGLEKMFNHWKLLKIKNENKVNYSKKKKKRKTNVFVGKLNIHDFVKNFDSKMNSFDNLNSNTQHHVKNFIKDINESQRKLLEALD